MKIKEFIIVFVLMLVASLLAALMVKTTIVGAGGVETGAIKKGIGFGVNEPFKKPAGTK